MKVWLRNFNTIFSLSISKIMSKRIKVDLVKSITKNISSAEKPENPNMYIYLDKPKKSFSDKKLYSVIQLPNGLTALLISDTSEGMTNLNDVVVSSESESSESEDQTSSEDDDDMLADDGQVCDKKPSDCDKKLAACALSVGVGSFSDPESIPGLAHFLEHMIFMGSEKYPTENEFDVYIKKKGGSDNAFTECEYTTYYFDCHEAHLRGAMDIFSELFISPLMKRETMTKEREAIDSEFQMALPSDGSRRSQLLCSLANNSNPVHKFMWGNLITLRDNVKDDELYEAVHYFRKQHYSAHRMTLAIQAKLPLETLENWTFECFKNVPNNGLPPDQFLLTEPPFQEKEFCKLYIVEPIKNVNSLFLTWVMPSNLKLYKSKPLNYLSWIIGHEGKGSLLSYLRKKLWSIGLSVNSGGDGTEENAIFTLFTISLTLTKEGTNYIDEILNAVFSYIQMLQRAGPQERLFKEVQLIAETSFRYCEEVPSSDNVEQLSENMQFYPSDDYITGSELYFEYKPELIEQFLDNLRPNNVNIMISSKLIASTEILDKTEPWFGTRYVSKEIPLHWTDSWKDAREINDFHLPEPNPFIAKDFSILPVPNSVLEYPEKIVKDDGLELWFKQDVKFNLPHAFCCLHLISPIPHKSAENAAMLDLFIAVLKQHLMEDLYPANVADLEYGLHSGEKGIVITLNGFNEKLVMVLQVIISGMKSLSNDLKRDLVLSMKDELIRSYQDVNLKTSFLARDVRMSILLETFWTAVEKKSALVNVTYEKLKEFVPEYLKDLYIQCLIQGNISKYKAIEFTNLTKNTLGCKPIPYNAVPEIRVHQLTSEKKCCAVQSFNSGDVNSVVTNYYQSGLGSIREHCVIELLMMMMEEPIFDSLRTQQQLGYDVSCSLRDTFGVLGFSISVHFQSDRHNETVVESRISQFLVDFLQSLKKTSIEEFKEIQESLIQLKKCQDVHLKEEVKRNWDEIKSGEYVFDRIHKEREILENLTLEDVIEWFKNNSGLSEENKCRTLSIQVVGKISNQSAGPNDVSNDISTNTASTSCELIFLPQYENEKRYINNIKEFRKSLTLYPIHKIT